MKMRLNAWISTEREPPTAFVPKMLRFVKPKSHLNWPRWVAGRSLVAGYKRFGHIYGHLPVGSWEIGERKFHNYSLVIITYAHSGAQRDIPLSWESIVSISMSLLNWWLMFCCKSIGLLLSDRYSSKLYRVFSGSSSSTNTIPVPDFRRGLEGMMYVDDKKRVTIFQTTNVNMLPELCPTYQAERITSG